MSIIKSKPQSHSLAQKAMERTVHLERSVEHVQEIVQKNPALSVSFSHTIDFCIGAVVHSHAQLYAMSGDGILSAYCNVKTDPQHVEMLAMVIQQLTRTIETTIGFRLKANGIAQKS